jgi:rod shape-determining protein MreC
MSGENWRVEFSMAQRNGGFVQLVPPPTIPKPVPIEDIEPADPDAEPIGASPTQGARQ